MLKRPIRRSAIILFILTLVVFLVVQILFKTQEIFQFSDFQYIIATSIANAFVITSIYAFVAASNLLKWNNKPGISFIKIFKLSFLPGFIAGVLSLLCVFAYFHYVDPSGIEQLKTEYLDYSLVQAKVNGDYEDVEKVINSPEVRNTNLLNNKTFTLILGILIFFNFSLALMLSFLWKIRNTPKPK